MSTKIHALVEGLGNLARFILTGGQRHDVTQAPALLEGLHPDAVIADKAFDADPLLEQIAHMPAPRATRKHQRAFDQHRYKHRNLIERFFARIIQFRRIATRYDKLAHRYAAFIYVTASFIWLA